MSVSGITIQLLTQKGVEAYKRDLRDREHLPKRDLLAYNMMYSERWDDHTIRIKLRKTMQAVDKVTDEYGLIAKLIATIITTFEENGARLDVDYRIKEYTA